MPRKSTNRVIRAPEFGARFRRACDESPHCLPKHEGRYGWVIGEYARRRKDKVSIETCRKWHEGEAQPRRDKIPTLANIFGVDPVWLETGTGSPAGYKILDGQAVEESILPIENSSIGTKIPPTSVPITIRPNLTVEIVNLPSDLSHPEAKRIANIVLAYAADE